MKSSLTRLGKFALNHKYGGGKEVVPPEWIGPIEEPQELHQGMQVVEKIQLQSEGLLSVGCMISSAAYDFSRSFQEMASYMVETLAQIHISDSETGNIFDMLGKVQFEISKILDAYCGHVSQTIIKPTESLMTELQHFKDMKIKYNEKREVYNNLCTQRPKGKVKNGKGDLVDQKLSLAKGELDDCEMTLCSRLQSLQQGRPLSLATQAVRFYAAQETFFSNGLDCLHAVEPAMEQLSQRRNIDRRLSERDVGIYCCQDEMEQSREFLEHEDRTESLYSSPSSSQADDANSKWFRQFPQSFEIISKSAPPSTSPYNCGQESQNLNKLHLEKPTQKPTYVLPSPPSKIDDQINPAGGPFNDQLHFNRHHQGTFELLDHLSPRFPNYPYSYTTLDGKHINDGGNTSNIRFSYSGPTAVPPVTTPMHQVVDPLYKSDPLRGPSITPPFISPKMSPTVSPSQISELYKLPVPSSGLNSPLPKRANLVPHSAPLGRKIQEMSPNLDFGSTFPLPPPILLMRSLSIPSSSSRSWRHESNDFMDSRRFRSSFESEPEPFSPALKPMPIPIRMGLGQVSPVHSPLKKVQ